MIMNLIFLLCLYPVLPIIYFVMKSNSKPKKNILLGVTLPTEFLNDPEVLLICSQYKKLMKKYILIMAVIPIPFFFIKYISINTMLWMLWLILLIFMSSLPYIKCNKKLSLLKSERQWLLRNSGKVIVDTKTISEKGRTMNLMLYLPPIILSFVPSLYEIFNKENSEAYLVKLIVILSTGFISLLFFMIAVLIERKKAEVISLNSDINTNFNRAKKHIWEICFLQLAWLNTIFTFALCAFMEGFIKSNLVFLFLSILYSIIILFLCLNTWFKITEVQQKFMSKAYDELDHVAVDDDKNWIWGMIYYNPNEGSTMVDKRDGYGLTINMACTAGKFLMGIAFLALLSIPVVGIWLMFEEFTPIKLELNDQQIIVEQIKTEYTVDIDKIKEIRFINKLPNARRTNGTGMNNLEKGAFTVDGYGECKLCLNPQNNSFIVIKTAHNTYIFSDEDNNTTKEVYDRIKEEQRLH